MLAKLKKVIRQQYRYLVGEAMIICFPIPKIYLLIFSSYDNTSLANS